MTIPTFTGKYASIRKDIYKGTLGQKFKPGASVYLDNKFHEYKTETGYYKAQEKVFQQKMAIIDMIESASYPKLATINVDWKKSTYGWQAKAILSYVTYSGKQVSITGDRTGGGGYDKQSSAIANVLNKSPAFMKLLFDARVKKQKLPYGADLYIGEPSLPRYAWGVGWNSHVAVLKACGYNERDVAYLDHFQTYELTSTKRRV